MHKQIHRWRQTKRQRNRYTRADRLIKVHVRDGKIDFSDRTYSFNYADMCTCLHTISYTFRQTDIIIYTHIPVHVDRQTDRYTHILYMYIHVGP